MKRIIFFAALLLCAGEVLSQSRYYMRYDSVYFERGGGNSEFILRNATRDSTGGLLTNVWGGRTQFIKPRQRIDSLFIGLDTFVVGGRGTEHLGSLYQKNNWTDLSDFVNTGTDALVSSGNIAFTTGSSSFTQYLSVDRHSMLERWTESVLFRVDEKSGASTGVGIGIRSSNSSVASNAIGRFNMTTDGNSGKVSLYLYNGTLAATSATAVSFSVNDFILLTVEMDVDVITVTAKNITTNGTPVSVYYQYSLNTAPFINNTGKFSVFPMGGAFTLDSLSVSSTETKYSDLLIVGDSKSQGYNTSGIMRRYKEILLSRFPNIVLHAGSGDKIADALNSVNEIIALKPKLVLLAVGRNDIAQLVDSNTIKTNYQSLTDLLTNQGIVVYHLLPFYETAVDQEWFKDFILRTYINVIDTWSPTVNCNTCLATDNAHLTDFGNSVVAQTIIESFQLSGGRNIDQWNLKRVLNLGDSANKSIVLGPSRRNGLTYTGTFSQPMLHLTNTSYPSIRLHTASTSATSGGSSIIWTSAIGGSKISAPIFGDSAFFAIVAHQASADSRNLAFFMADTGAVYYVPLNIRSTKADFFGTRTRPTVEAWYNLFAGANVAGSNNFSATNAVFAVNASNFPIDIYNLATIDPDTATYQLLIRHKTNGQTYGATYWPSLGGGGGGGGTVTDFAFTDGSGFDGTVTSSTSTPTLALTTSLTAGSVPIIGASGALTEDNTNFYFDNTNNRLGLGTTAPTHPLTLAQTQAFSGATLYKTTDQVTNFGRGNIRMRSSGTTPIMEYDIQTGGTVTGGYHSFMVAGVEKLTVDAAQASFSGNFFFSPDATHDIGRLSGSPFRPRNLYLSGSAQFGAPANTSIARQLHVVTQNAVTNAITNLARFAHMTSGTAATGSGVGIEFEAENASGTQIITSSITNPYTTATAGSETAELAFNVVLSGSSSERLRLGQYLSTPTGTTSRSARHGGVVWNTISTVSTSGTSETDLHTRTTEASVLAADGEWIEWKSIGILNPGNTENGATITIRAYWAGTEVFETAATAPAAAVPYTITVRVQRMSSSSAMVTTEITGGGFGITLISPAIVNVTTTFSNTNILKVTGETTDADQALNAITSEFKWFPTNQ